MRRSMNHVAERVLEVPIATKKRSYTANAAQAVAGFFV